MVTKLKPRTSEEMEEVLLNPTKYKDMISEPESLRSFMGDYIREHAKHDPGLKEQIKNGMVEGWKQLWAAQEARAPVRRLPMSEESAAPSSYGLGGFRARKVASVGAGLGSKLDGVWPTLKEYLISITPQMIQTQGVPEVFKVLSEGGGAEGGFLVPEEFRVELLQMALEQAVVRPRARVIPMTRQTLKVPAIRDSSHATSVYGGIQASWVAEAGTTSTVRQPTFAQVVLQAKKLTGYTQASNELAQDGAISLEAVINDLFPQAIAYFEDDAFINGTGVGQPQGILNADALVSVAKETGQAATTLVYENLAKMFARMLPASLSRAVWVAHPDIFPQLAALSLSVGTGGAPVWLANAAGGPPSSIFGRPIIFTEKCKTLGTAGDIYFVDFSYYLIGDRMALQIMASPHVAFTTDETVWRFIQRVDGRPWITVALTPRNGTNTMSPFVALATRA